MDLNKKLKLYLDKIRVSFLYTLTTRKKPSPGHRIVSFIPAGRRAFFFLFYLAALYTRPPGGIRVPASGRARCLSREKI